MRILGDYTSWYATTPPLKLPSSTLTDPCLHLSTTTNPLVSLPPPPCNTLLSLGTNLSLLMMSLYPIFKAINPSVPLSTQMPLFAIVNYLMLPYASYSHMPPVSDLTYDSITKVLL